MIFKKRDWLEVNNYYPDLMKLIASSKKSTLPASLPGNIKCIASLPASLPGLSNKSLRFPLRFFSQPIGSLRFQLWKKDRFRRFRFCFRFRFNIPVIFRNDTCKSADIALFKTFYRMKKFRDIFNTSKTITIALFFISIRFCIHIIWLTGKIF